MKKRHVFLIGIMCMSVLCACKREEVDYSVSSLTGTENNDQNEVTSESLAEGGNLLKYSLGIGDEWRWKEIFGSGEKSASIQAHIYVPEASDMYVMTVKEHYYSSEDKKKIAETLLDPGSISVNIYREPSKEWADTVLEMCDKSLKEVENHSDDRYEFLYANTGGLSNYKESISNIYSTLPDRSTISADVGDYSANNYFGTINGVRYMLNFTVNPDKNDSSFTLVPVDFDDIAGEDVFMPRYFGEYFPPYGFSYKNTSEMTLEEAQKEAEDLCAKLGMPYMKLCAYEDLDYGRMENGEIEDVLVKGYYMLLGRECEGTYTDPATMYYEGSDLPQELQDNRPYFRERVEVAINENGIAYFKCEGPMDLIEEPVKADILGFPDVKASIGEKACEKEQGVKTKWNNLYLSYTRIPDENEEDVYRYVPSWRLNSYDYEYLKTSGINENVIINAIDGSEIDPVKIGAVDFNYMEEYLYCFTMEN